MMAIAYDDIVAGALERGGMLDALLALQHVEGYVSEEGISAVARALGRQPGSVYDAASFYGMLRFEPLRADVDVRVCQSAPCCVEGAAEVLAAVERELGVRVGEVSADGSASLGVVECLGQCGCGPAMLVNGKLHTKLTPEGAVQAIREEAGRA